MFLFHADIVLKDKAIVYDLGAQRIGWVDHDCKSFDWLKDENREID